MSPFSNSDFSSSSIDWSNYSGLTISISSSTMANFTLAQLMDHSSICQSNKAPNLTSPTEQNIKIKIGNPTNITVKYSDPENDTVTVNASCNNCTSGLFKYYVDITTGTKSLILTPTDNSTHPGTY
jgi:hypothetical protein